MEMWEVKEEWLEAGQLLDEMDPVDDAVEM